MDTALFPLASQNWIAACFEWLILDACRHVATSAVKEYFIDFNMLNLKGLLNPSCFQLIDVLSAVANNE